MKLLIITLAISISSFALTVSEVKVFCSGGDSCINVEQSFSALKREYFGIEHLKRTVKLYLLNQGVKSLSYKALAKNQTIALEITVELKEKIESLDIINGDVVDVPTVLPINENDFYDEEKVKETKKVLKNLLISKGYTGGKVTVKKSKEESGVALSFEITPMKAVEVSEIIINSQSNYVKSFLKKSLSSLSGKSLDQQRIKTLLEEARVELVSFGHYFIDLEYQVKTISSHDVKLIISTQNSDLYAFRFNVVTNKAFPLDKQKLTQENTGKKVLKASSRCSKFKLSVFSDYELKEKMKDYFSGFRRKVSGEAIKSKVQEAYEEAGRKNTLVKVSMAKSTNFFKDTLNTYTIEVLEGTKLALSSLSFAGVRTRDKLKLRKLFYKSAPSIVKSNLYLKSYISSFKELIRDYFIQKGFLKVNVALTEKEGKEGGVEVIYRVELNSLYEVSSFKIKGVSEELSKELKDEVSTKAGLAFNPSLFEEDITKIEGYLYSKGYFNVKIVNKNSAGIVKFSEKTNSIDIEVLIDVEDKIYVDKVVIVGNHKTRSSLIKKEILLKSGDLITRKTLRRSQTNLLGLGIFSSVTVRPIINYQNFADILIVVNEKEFGTIELAPGIRTDLGLKVSGGVSYNNLDGLNKKISFKGQVNQRFNLYSLDDERREKVNSLVEYNATVKYSENYLFKSDWRFSSSLTQSRQRFFAFDADIYRTNFIFTRDFTEWLSLSTKYQFETIRQFQATKEIDEGTFQIGALIPAVTLDFRNNRTNPTSGSWFNLSYERANPALASQNNNELVIDYYKIVSRNRLYLPMKNGTVAVSLAMGVQKNLASSQRLNSKGEFETVGFIPNIKVFRLNGIDTVRGYEDIEVNTLANGDDISDARVSDEAYMAVVKVEPRFFLNDTSMIGVFYDAGRVFVGDYDLGELKSSVGVTFKFLTPVGSLDFDYGIKLLRNNNDGDKFVAPGRFHVSIGFF